MSGFGVILVRIRENVDQSNSDYGHFLENYGEYLFVFASVNSVKVKKLLNKQYDSPKESQLYCNYDKCFM